MTNNPAILFDLDGTLVNSLPDICGVVNLVREKLSLRLMPAAEVRPKVGRGMDYLVAHCFTEIPEAERTALVDTFRELYFEQPHHGGALYPDVLPTLTTLREAGLKVAVATNKQTRIAIRTLEFYLPEFTFDLVVGHDSVSERKPSARHLLETLERLGVGALEAWMVGDDNIDRQAAYGAGVNFLAATWGFGGVQAEKSECVQGFKEILHRIIPTKV